MTKYHKGATTGHYRLNSATIFWHDVYARRMNVESVIYVIKRRFNGGNYSRSTKLQNKETKGRRWFNWKTPRPAPIYGCLMR